MPGADGVAGAPGIQGRKGNQGPPGDSVRYFDIRDLNLSLLYTVLCISECFRVLKLCKEVHPRG